MKEKDSLFEPIKWKAELRRLFPEISPGNKKALEWIYRNWENHKARNFNDKDCEFAWFYQTLKMTNRKFREENIFILWLWLAVSRPWEKGEFVLEWKGEREKDFYRVLDILEDLEKKYGLDFRSLRESSGIKTFYRYKKNVLVRANIASIYTIGYSRLMSGMRFSRNYKRFIDLLKSGSLVTKREFQRKLRLNSEEFNSLIKEAEKKDIIEIRRFSKNSLGLFYKSS